MAIEYTRELLTGNSQSFQVPFHCLETTDGTAIDISQAVLGALSEFQARYSKVATDHDVRELSFDSARVTCIYNPSYSPLDPPLPGVEVRNRLQYSAPPKFLYFAKEFVAGLPQGIESTLYVNIVNTGSGNQHTGMSVAPPPVTHVKEYRWEGVITDGLARTLSGCAGRTNSDGFFGYAPGELFLASYTAQQVNNTQSQLTLGFAHQESDSQDFGELGSLTIPPHHIYWSYDEHVIRPFTIPNRPGTYKYQRKQPVYAVTQRVYDSAPFSQLGLPDMPTAQTTLRSLNTQAKPNPPATDLVPF